MGYNFLTVACLFIHFELVSGVPLVPETQCVYFYCICINFIDFTNFQYIYIFFFLKQIWPFSKDSGCQIWVRVLWKSQESKPLLLAWVLGKNGTPGFQYSFVTSKCLLMWPVLINFEKKLVTTKNVTCNRQSPFTSSL